MKIQLSQEERPIGYRSFRRKAVWYHSSWSTLPEARKERDNEILHGRSATVVEAYLDRPPKYVIVYNVYSANN